ncbi:hypothetical protein GCM10011360_17920 [Primorskyibacter flagellatus]|uniref:DUF1364 domain-containing protein n=1 Tax=Primorskyibacter flagellatus TaxID=1387277 RepID=A0A917A6R0_9RHOB|nr:nuclease domain-containing protein [Primorskyibacter flagellatus]GGE30310.1 hypothetical protein GCM10011360_17920 [Primorskyibacter flagellatus]
MEAYRPHMNVKMRSEKVTDHAKGQPCTIRIASFVPGRQCSGQDTTVFTHFGGPTKGTSTKVSDFDGGFGCAVCHSIIDGPDKKAREYLFERYPAAVENRMRLSVSETLSILFRDGIITVDGAEIVGKL